MVAKGFGSRDSDKVGKEKTDKPMLKASKVTPYTGKIGGPANVPARQFKRGGGVKRGR